MKDNHFFEAALEGKPLHGELIIDCHAHLNPYYNFMIPKWDLTSLVASAKRIGISKMYASSLQAICSNALAGNSDALEKAKKYHPLIQIYLVYKPNYPEEIETIVNTAKKYCLNQFKIHDEGNNHPYNHPNYFKLYEYSNDHESVVLIHTYGNKHLPAINNIAALFPKMKILLAHAGIIDEDDYIKTTLKYDNVYLDISSSWDWHGLIEKLVNKCGSERVLFGTDNPFLSPEQSIGRILFARIHDEEKRKILGLNAQSLFTN